MLQIASGNQVRRGRCAEVEVEGLVDSLVYFVSLAGQSASDSRCATNPNDLRLSRSEDKDSVVLAQVGESVKLI